MSDEIVRKIAVIFATDVVGYSKLMENDEDQTIKAIRACKEAIRCQKFDHGARKLNQPRKGGQLGSLPEAQTGSWAQQ